MAVPSRTIVTLFSFSKILPFWGNQPVARTASSFISRSQICRFFSRNLTHGQVTHSASLRSCNSQVHVVPSGVHSRTRLTGCVGRCRFYATQAQRLDVKPMAIQKHMSLSSKRVARKRKDALLGKTEEGLFQATAYSTAEEYDLESLKKAIQDHGLYVIKPLPNDAVDAVCVHAKYQVEEEPREIYFFREGSVVFWNMLDEERSAVLKFLKRYQEDGYDKDLVQEEFDSLDYIYHSSETELLEGKVYLAQRAENTAEQMESTKLEKYAFSNALALSVKLSIWEASLAKYINSIEYISEDLKMAHKIRLTKDEVLRKTGELFTLRHLINLSSDLLDTPDFYWDRDHLERLYNKTCTNFKINLRTRVMNEKLNHCVELTELLRSQLNDAHQARLEVIIIVLILVECLFECIHLFERHWDPNPKEQVEADSS